MLAFSNAEVPYDRPTKEVRVKGTLKTKFDKERKKAAKEKTSDPRDGADQIALKRAAVDIAISQDMIGRVRKLIELSKKGSLERAEYHHRLADHLLDLKAYHEFQVGELEEVIFQHEQAREHAKAKTARARQARHKKAAKSAAKQAVAELAKLADNRAYDKYKHADQVLFSYAFELGLLGRQEAMQRAYVKLVHDFPTSKYTANAFLALGDFKFAQSDIANAVRLYQKVVDGYPSSPVYAYALYKLAWCYLNPQGAADPQYSKSLATFVDSIKATLAGRAGSEANARLLRRDARRDLVRAYVHAGKPSAAWAFFERVGQGPKKSENMARKMMEGLALAYFSEGHYVESSYVYRRLQQLFEEDPMTCEWQYRIVVNALATDDAGIQWKETERLASRWGDAAGSKWSKVDKKRCRDKTEEMLQRMATVWHSEADKTSKDATYEYARKAYEAYLKHFERAKSSYDCASTTRNSCGNKPGERWKPRKVSRAKPSSSSRTRPSWPRCKLSQKASGPRSRPTPRCSR